MVSIKFTCLPVLDYFISGSFRDTILASMAFITAKNFHITTFIRSSLSPNAFSIGFASR